MTTVADRIHRLRPILQLGLRTGLALALAYWIALSMNWAKPVWAGFSVATVSLDTTGASLERGLLRVWGTVIGAVAGLLLIALFPQERWAFITWLSVWCGFSCYRMLEGHAPYVWLIASFTCPVVAIIGGPPDGTRDFSIAIERLQETTAGVVAFSLVATVLTPGSARQRFEEAVTTLMQDCRSLWSDVLQDRPPSQLRQRRDRIRASLAAFGTLLDAAAQESGSLLQRKSPWQRSSALVRRLVEDLERARNAVHSIPDHHRHLLDDGLASLDAMVPARLQWLERQAKGGHQVNEPPEDLLRDCVINGPPPEGLEPTEVALLRLGFEELRGLDRRTIALLSHWARVGAEALPAWWRPGPSAAPDPWRFDPDHLLGAWQAALAVWIGSLLWIFLPALPDGPLVVAFLAAFATVLAGAPGVSAARFIPTVLLAFVVATLVYILVFPRLEGFFGLAVLLVVISLFYHLLFATKPLVRVIGIVVVVIVLGITNLQTYSFVSIINLTLSCLLAFAILLFTPEIPFSSRAEKVWLRQYKRFRRSVAALLHSPRPGGWQQGWRRFHLSEVERLPARLSATALRLEPADLGCRPDQVVELLERIEILSLWLRRRESPAGISDPMEEKGIELQVRHNLQRLADAEAAIDWEPWRQPRFSWF